MKKKILAITTCFWSSISAAQFDVPDKEDTRLMPDDMSTRIDSEYKRLYEETISETGQIQGENERLKLELDELKRKLEYQSPGEQVETSPATISNSLGDVPGNQTITTQSQQHNRTRAAPTRTLASGLQVFAVSEQAASELTVLPAGSWVRAKLLTGVQANARYPYNVLMQLDYAYTGPNGIKIPLNGCLVLGGATADLSIERVIIAPHTLSCVRDNKEYLQRKVQGFVAGKDSSNGMMGVYDSKQSKVFLQAVLAGIVKGASEAYEIANSTTTLSNGTDGTTTPITNFKGKFAELAIARGIGKPAEMVTGWYLEQAKALLPTIHVGSGQDVWIVMTDKVDVPDLRTHDGDY